jgi:hypothetical protein
VGVGNNGSRKNFSLGWCRPRYESFRSWKDRFQDFSWARGNSVCANPCVTVLLPTPVRYGGTQQAPTHAKAPLACFSIFPSLFTFKASTTSSDTGLIFFIKKTTSVPEMYICCYICCIISRISVNLTKFKRNVLKSIYTAQNKCNIYSMMDLDIIYRCWCIFLNSGQI